MSVIFFLFASVFVRVLWKKKRPKAHWISPILALALPFSAGGFHIIVSALLSMWLALALLEQMTQNGILCFHWNRHSFAILILFVAYCVTPFWAADKGMAVFAIPKYLVLMLYMLLLMQTGAKLQQEVLDLIPACGSLMTILSVSTLLSPDLRDYVIVNGRLAGCFQYPNSFAAFLLVALIIQSFRGFAKPGCMIAFLLISGIIISGSKTVFVLMLLVLLLMILIKRQRMYTLILGGALLCGLGTGLFVNTLGILPNADRFTTIHVSSGTFLVRLLYFADAIPAIFANPFGIGYMGYPAIEGIIQTSRYFVTYIHNEFLQILLEAGWIPGILIGFGLLTTLLSAQTTSKRLVLFAILSHCMLDFDLQFSIFWIIVLSCVDFHSGKKVDFGLSRVAGALLSIFVVLSLWLGVGDWFYHVHKFDICLGFTPFHTKALEVRLSDSDNLEEIDQIADRILSMNATHSLSYSAKANVAFSTGDIPSMIAHKENAIHFSPYSIAEYCDYFDKLYWAMQMYLQTNDTQSAAFCRNKLLQIPEMMVQVSQKTHPLADLTGDDSSLQLPDEYTAVLWQLQNK